MLPLLLLSRRRGATAALLAPLAAAARANPAPANHSPLAGGVAPPVAFYQAPFQAAAAFHAASGSRGDSFNPILPDARPPDCAAPLGAESPVPLHAKRMPHLDRRIGFMGSGQMAEGGRGPARRPLGTTLKAAGLVAAALLHPCTPAPGHPAAAAQRVWYPYHTHTFTPWTLERAGPQTPPPQRWPRRTSPVPRHVPTAPNAHLLSPGPRYLNPLGPTLTLPTQR